MSEDPRRAQKKLRLALESLKLVIGKCLDFYAPEAKKLLTECLFGQRAPQNAHNQQQISILTPSGSIVGWIRKESETTLLKKLETGGISWANKYEPPEFFNLWGSSNDVGHYLLPYNVPISELPSEVFLMGCRDEYHSKKCALKIVKKAFWNMKSFSEALRADREFVLAAVTWDGLALEYASKALRADRWVVLAAVTEEGSALQFASKALRADKDVVLAAVTQNGYALEDASVALRADKDVVLAAVTRYSDALMYASNALQADREVVLAAAGL